MRWLSFEYNGVSSFGYLENDDAVVNVGSVSDLLDLKTAIADRELETLVSEIGYRAERISTSEMTFLPPIPNPSKILCVGLNYVDHQKETGRGGEDFPTIFIRFPSVQVGHNQPILRPIETSTLDFEGEIALVIGKSGRRIPTESYLEHVFGFSCYNDGSVREYQRHSSQFTPGKNFMGTGGFGPWIMTTDEIGCLDEMQLSTHLNGELMQHACSSDMVFGFAELVHYCSTFVELEPGDVIVTGTPGGVGAMRSPPIFMSEGDEISITVSPIGTLTNPVLNES